MNLGFPIYSLCPGFNKYELLVAGGGGSSRSGVPNALKFGQIGGDGRIKIIDTREFCEQVTCVASCHSKKKSYASYVVGSRIVLMNRRYEEITSYDTKMKKPIFRSLDFSPAGNMLVSVDGDDTLRLLSLPSMNEIASTRSDLVQRAEFIAMHKKAQIVCTMNKRICVFEADNQLSLVTESDEFDLTPKEIKVMNEIIYFLGVNEQKKTSAIVKLRYTGRSLKVLKYTEPLKAFITAMTVAQGSVIAATSTGKIVILNSNDLKKEKIIPKVHEFPVPAITTVNEFICSGSLDCSLCINVWQEKKNYKYLVVILAILIFINVIVIILNLK